MASNFWGIPRTTHDLDFVLAHEWEHAPRIAAAFASDYTIDEIMVRNALEAPYMFNAIDRRSALKVDFWTLRPDRFEQQMFSRRMQLVLFGESAWVATAEDTLLHKLHCGDAAGIVAVQGSALDREYLVRWARELDLAETLDDLLEGRIRPKST
jgi:hypothetical protein